MIQMIAPLLGGVLLFVLPAMIFAPIRRLTATSTVTERFALFSLAPLIAIPIGFYLTSLLGLNLNRVLGLALLIAFLSLGVIALLRLKAESAPIDRYRGLLNPSLGILLLLTLVTILLRLWVIRDMDYPLWTDSYHHTVIATLIRDLGQIPDGYRPYAPIDSFTYHFGVHSVAAFYAWLRNIPIPRALLEVGQIINALAVPGLYLFTYSLTKKRNAALLAAVVVGLLSHMPAQYVNWGRYTQLAGLTLLPASLVLSMDALRKDASRRSLLWAGLSAVALFLIHYRIFLFYLLWMLPFTLSELWIRRRQPEMVKATLGRSIVIATLFLITIAPWLVELMSGFGSTVAGDVVEGYEVTQHGTYFDDFRFEYLYDFGMSRWLLALAAASAVYGLIRRRRSSLLLVSWVILLLTTANLHRIGIMPLYPTNVVLISLYVPGSVLIGVGMAELIQMAERYLAPGRVRLLAGTVAVIALVVLSTQGARHGIDLVAPENGFVDDQDLVAMEWIEQNTDADALFYVATSFWTPVVAHGVDGGYWIPYLAARQTIMPPQIYASDGSSEYMNQVNRRLRDLHSAADLDRFWQVLVDNGISHLYLDQVTSRFPLEWFKQYPDRFILRYAGNQISIFEVQSEQ